jgi:hypothetical protein
MFMFGSIRSLAFALHGCSTVNLSASARQTAAAAVL